MGVTFTATDSIEYEPGVYRARLKELEVAESSILDEKTGQPGLYMKWTFDLLDDGYEGHTLRGNSSMNFGPRAKARAWAEGLLARKIESGESIDEDDLIGKECDLMIRMEETDRGTFARVESVNPVRKKKGTRKEEEKTDKAVEEAEKDFDDIPF
jgi:hypothetical protein